MVDMVDMVDITYNSSHTISVHGYLPFIKFFYSLRLSYFEKEKKQIWVPSRCSVFILSTHCLSSLVETEQNWNGVLYKIRPRLMETFQTLIKEMNRLGMIVDLSHSSVQVIILSSLKYFQKYALSPASRQPVTRWRSLLPLWFSLTLLLKHCATLHEMYLTNSSSWR